MIIDSHCHVYPDAIASKAVQGISTFYDGIEGYSDGRISTLRSLGEKLGVDHAVIFSVATTVRQVDSINAFIKEAVDSSGGSFTGLGAIHPDSPEKGEVVSRIVELGLKGIKTHPDTQKAALDDERWFPLYEAAAEKGLPVLVHCGDYRFDFSNPKRMKRTLELFPKTQFIGAHFGGWSKWDEAVELLAPFDNFVVDSSSTRAWVPVEKAKEYVLRYGTDRVLFATDFPMGDVEKEILFFRDMKLRDEDYGKIFEKNARRVFGI